MNEAPPGLASPWPREREVDDDGSTLSPELLKERQLLREQLELQRWNVSHVAKSLGISRNTLYRRMHKLCIPVTQTA